MQWNEYIALLIRAFLVVYNLPEVNAQLVQVQQQGLQEVDFKYEVNITGTGSFFPENVFASWVNVYPNLAINVNRAVNIQLDYKAAGSIVGERAAINKEVHFGMTDKQVSDEDFQSTSGQLRVIPLMVGALAISYTIPDIEGQQQLFLDKVTLRKLFAGDYAYWDHPDLVVNNDMLKNVHQKIHLVLRQEVSGQTNLLTAALSAFRYCNWSLIDKIQSNFHLIT